jgi:hypothetical protein
MPRPVCGWNLVGLCGSHIGQRMEYRGLFVEVSESHSIIAESNTEAS